LNLLVICDTLLASSPLGNVPKLDYYLTLDLNSVFFITTVVLYYYYFYQISEDDQHSHFKTQEFFYFASPFSGIGIFSGKFRLAKFKTNVQPQFVDLNVWRVRRNQNDSARTNR
jgi:hypothetical protein